MENAADVSSEVYAASSAELIASCAMLVVVSVVGIAGNSLVSLIYLKETKRHISGKRKSKDSSLSSVYILVLALMDLVTSVVTVPGTIVVEWFEFKMESDLVCKLYHLVLSSTVPTSALIMAAIAVDRCLRIHFPRKYNPTGKNIAIQCAALVSFGLFLGLIASLCFGVKQRVWRVSVGQAKDFASLGVKNDQNSVDTWANTPFLLFDNIRSLTRENETEFRQEGRCELINTIFSFEFQDAFKAVHAAVFLISLVVIIIAYATLFVRMHLYNKKRATRLGRRRLCVSFAASHRRKIIRGRASLSFNRPTASCVDSSSSHRVGISFSPPPLKDPRNTLNLQKDRRCTLNPEKDSRNIANMADQDSDMPRDRLVDREVSTSHEVGKNKSSRFVERTKSRQHKDNVAEGDESEGGCKPEEESTAIKTPPSPAKNAERSCIEESANSVKSNPTCNAEPLQTQEKKLARQILVRYDVKCACMLFTVTLVFVLTYVPAALMIYKIVPFNLPVFYIYFANNMINPLIYSMFSREFRIRFRSLCCAGCNHAINDTQVNSLHNF